LARVTALLSAVVALPQGLVPLMLMLIFKLLLRAVRESLRFSLTWSDHRYVSAQAS
jgi:hypothetical protein